MEGRRRRRRGVEGRSGAAGHNGQRGGGARNETCGRSVLELMSVERGGDHSVKTRRLFSGRGTPHTLGESSREKLSECAGFITLKVARSGGDSHTTGC